MFALPPANLVSTQQQPAAAPSLSTPPPATPAVVAAPQVVQRVSVTQVPTRTDLLTSEGDWTWQELRDYVVAQIEQASGPFPRDAKKEFGIFSRFHREHGAAGIEVAKYAFETLGGWWQGAPVSVTRFCKGSDPFFAIPIMQRLADIREG